MIDKEGLGSQDMLACKDVAASCPGVSVICLCSQGSKGARDTQAGADGDDHETVSEGASIYHIEKPITVWSLERAINKMRQNSSFSDTIAETI